MNSRRRRLENQNPGGSSVYPLPPPESRLVYRMPEADLSTLDRCVVAGTSLFIVGSFLWVPLVYAFALRKWRSIPAHDKKRRAVYAAILVASLALMTVKGPHRSPRVGAWLRVRKWPLWSAWLKFIAMEVRADRDASQTSTMPKDDTKVLQAFVPHGIFPFAFAFGALPDIASKAFGRFRPVVATATNFFPVVNDFLLWLNKMYVCCSPLVVALSVTKRWLLLAATVSLNCGCMLRLLATKSTSSHARIHARTHGCCSILFMLQIIHSDASKEAVNLALSKGDRVGIVPGGIAEIFEGYPKEGTRPDEEYSIVRKGFLRLALQHGVPVVPIYCFGATKMFRRLNLPVLERLSSLIRASVVVFYGVWGLPIPFRQKLLYVIGNPIVPPSTMNGVVGEEQAVDDMHRQFCEELLRIFDRNKESYGWHNKTLKLIAR